MPKSSSAKSGSLSANLRFDLPNHKIDSRTLGIVLVEMTKLVERANRHVQPDMIVRVNIRTPQDGSFDLPIEIYAASVIALLENSSALAVLKQILGTVVDFIKLKQLLKGKEPKSETRKPDGIHIVGDNNVVIVVNPEASGLYRKDAEAHSAVERQFKALEADKTIQKFEVIDPEKENQLVVPREEFQDLSAPRSQAEKKELEQIEQRENTLVITKPLLENKQGKWDFLDSEGLSFSATMVDEKFLKEVESGEQFAMGDRLQVEIEITRIFDASLGAHKIKHRRVLKVLNHFKRPEQDGLF